MQKVLRKIRTRSGMDYRQKSFPRIWQGSETIWALSGRCFRLDCDAIYYK